MTASHLQIPSGSHPDQAQNNHAIPSPIPFELTIRFSASIPDLQITIPTVPEPTTATLKQLIRSLIPADLNDRRIRLIHAGKALEDAALLSTNIRRPVSQLPSRTGTPSSNDNGATTSAKGKEPVRDPPILSRVYVHCSIGDIVLSAAELTAEKALADREKTQKNESHGSNARIIPGAFSGDNHSDGSTAPAPRGFDRLLSAGFSAAEVQNLRLQFMAIQAHVHTPDTMPSPNTLRDMEDRWLDNSNSPEAGGASNLGGGRLNDDDASSGAMDDMLWGAAIGFFWPVGCLFWGFREEGIWSQRRKMAIAVGLVLNIGIGLIRYTS